MDYSVIDFVENQTWLSYLEEMFTLLIGKGNIIAIKKTKEEIRIEANGFLFRGYVGVRENSRGYKADLVLNLVHNQEGYTPEYLQEINNVCINPILSARSARARMREER